MGVKTVLSAMVALVASHAAFAVDGWLKWCGDPLGGQWSDASNWEISGTSSYTVEELLKRSAGYQLDALQDGATLDYDSSEIVICRLERTAAASGTLTLTATNNANAMFPKTENAEFDIAAGNTVEWKINHANPWGGDLSSKKLIIMDHNGTGGTFHINPPTLFDSYKVDLQPCGHTTVILGPKYRSTRSYVTMWNYSTLKLESDLVVARIMVDTGCTLDMNGYKMSVLSGEAATTSGYPSLGGGTFANSRDIAWGGGQTWTVSSAMDLSGYVGDWLYYGGGMAFPSGFAFAANHSLSLNGLALLTFPTSVTLNNLKGSGTAGSINMGDGATLTLTSPVPTNGTFSARIAGAANVVKDGADYSLALSGDNRYTGSTTVSAGSLALKRPHLRNGLVRYWSFEDENNPLRDFSEWQKDLGIGSGNNPPTIVADGVGGGKALHFAPTASSTCYAATRYATQPEFGFPVLSRPVSLSLWLRPSSMPGDPTYIYRHGNWGGDGRQFTLWGRDKGTKLQVCIDNWPSSAANPNWPLISTPDLMNGKWHHVVVSYADNSIEMWYDGELKAKTTGTHTLNIPYSGNNASDIYLGSSETGKRYVGDVDEVCIWSHALSAEEVAADYSLANRVPAGPETALPEPVCHWAFDDDSNVGKDSMGRADLQQNQNVAATPTLTSKTGVYGKRLENAGSMRLPVADFPENFPTGLSPFTVSVRLIQNFIAENNTVLHWGGSDDGGTGAFRLWNSGCPRRLRLSTGCASGDVREFGWSYCNIETPGAYQHVVVTGDPVTGLLRMYSDGVLQTTLYDYYKEITPNDLVLNAKPSGTQTCAAGFDDVQIFNRALTPYEVQTLTRSLETGKVGEILPETSDVTVAAGAALSVDAPSASVKSLAGAGDVTIGPGTLLSVGSFDGFSGSVTGAGALVVSKAVPSGLSLQADVALGGNVDAAGAPLVETAGRVLVAPQGCVKFASEPTELPLRLVLAKGASAVAIGGLSGWTTTLDPACYRATFATTEDGEFVVTVKNRGMILLLR